MPLSKIFKLYRGDENQSTPRKPPTCQTFCTFLI